MEWSGRRSQLPMDTKITLIAETMAFHPWGFPTLFWVGSVTVLWVGTDRHAAYK